MKRFALLSFFYKMEIHFLNKSFNFGILQQ